MADGDGCPARALKRWQFGAGDPEYLPSQIVMPDETENGILLDPLARLLAPRLTEASKLSWSLFRRARPRPRRTNIDLKAQIDSVFRAASTKLIIMVDDVDRLNASEIRQVFQLIKLNANFTNTVYVVAFHKASVEEALREISPGPPGEYLETLLSG